MIHPLYRVRDWSTHFENSQSKKYRTISWVPLPNKHDGKSFRRLMRMPNGLTIYGAWVLIVQIASKCPTRGVLADSDGPLTADDISLKCDAPTELIADALRVLSSPAVGWLEVQSEHAGSTLLAHSEHATSALPAHSECTTLNRIEQKELNTPLPPKGGDADEDQTPDKQPVQRASADKPKPKRSKKLTKADLRDTATVLSWLKARSKKLDLDPEHHETRIRTLATAEGALRSDGPGFFEACMRNQRWEMLSDADLATGKRRLQEHDTSHLPGLVNQLSDKLAIGTIPGIDDAEGDDHE